jgi:hypothetical protein
METLKTEVVTREQFSEAVLAAISSVQHLYRALDRLMIELREALAEPPNALVAIPFTAGKAGKDSGRLVLRHEYGTLFRPIVSADEAEDDEDEEDDEEGEELDDEDTDRPKRKRSAPVVDAAESLLAVRIAMYEARQHPGFEPHIAFAVMNDWRIGDRRPDPGQPLTFMRHMLRRIPRALAQADRKKGASLLTAATVKKVPGAKKSKGDGRRLTCRLPMGVDLVPLYELDDASAVSALADRMKVMWVAAATDVARET